MARPLQTPSERSTGCEVSIEGAPKDERQGVPFTETIMADELPMNCQSMMALRIPWSTCHNLRMRLYYIDTLMGSNVVSSLPRLRGLPSSGSINYLKEPLETFMSSYPSSFINLLVAENCVRRSSASLLFGRKITSL
ncbi:UNVERIFIED_CONTAM: hypothetical protein Slati_4446200 [Sesamum latifolium]|uniref:Uncharacterized protein n=1 Tax=Sesamum latifolium TaxID=2727402 RepID=A0AAW2SRP4_9LAMI